MSSTTETFARVKIDALLKDAGWNLTDGSSVLFEHALPDGTLADYVLCDRQGRPMAALEAKRASIDPIAAQDQGRHYAEQLGIPFVFLSNGEEVRFLDCETDAHAREIAGFYAQDDLERRIAARQVRRDLSTVPIDRRIVDRDYQIACIEALSAEVSHGRRKLLVEMATGTGKTRTAAAFIKRLFEAGIVTRVLFLVDRIALARQAEEAFTDHLRDYPCHVLRPGRGFDRAKRITIATLQTMIAEYRALSPGYFDLVITDECHRSIYGKWSGGLRHFDGIQLGLTATPCTADADADALPDPEDGQFVRDTLRFFELAEPTFCYPLHRAIREGHLVPYRIYKAMTVKTAPDASAIVKRFKEEEYPQILVSVNMLDTGFDCPEAVNLVMARFTRSAILYRQMRGRGTRKAPHIGKTGFTIFDFVGVTDFHGDDEESVEGGVLRVAEQKATYETRMLLTLDVDDHIDPASRDWLTIDESGRIVLTPEHEARAAELGLRVEAWRGAHGEFDAEQARWAGLIGSRVKADAMHMDAFGGWDFDEHPFAALGGYDQARRVFGGEEPLGRLIAGFNAAVFGERPAAGEPDGGRAGER